MLSLNTLHGEPSIELIEKLKKACQEITDFVKQTEVSIDRLIPTFNLYQNLS